MRSVFGLFIGAAIVLLAGAAVSRADDAAPTEEDRQTFETCLSDAESDGSDAIDCEGEVSDLCMETPDAASTAGMSNCLARELALWDDMLNERYRRLAEGLAPDKVESLKEAQRVWIETRDKSCEFEASLWEGGTGAGPALIGCRVRETAWRAIFLSDLVDFRMQ